MKRRQNDFLMKNFYRKKLLSTGICKNVPYSGILANNKRKFRETLFSRISRWPYFAKFRENKFSRISRKCKSSKISRELIFANFAIVVQIAKINSRENKFSRKLVLAKISTFKVPKLAEEEVKWHRLSYESDWVLWSSLCRPAASS